MFSILIKKYKVYIGIVLCVVIVLPFCIKKINKVIDTTEVSKVDAEKIDHQNYGSWNSPYKMIMRRMEKIAGNYVMYMLGNQVISLETLENSSFCSKNNCIICFH